MLEFITINVGLFVSHQQMHRKSNQPTSPQTIDLLTNGLHLKRETRGRGSLERKNYAFGHIVEDYLHKFFHPCVLLILSIVTVCQSNKQKIVCLCRSFTTINFRF